MRAAAGAARTVVDVGAGTGSHEQGLPVVPAVEPTPVTIAQRPPGGGAPGVRGEAERVPLGDASVDVALAVRRSSTRAATSS
ncbi:class I SAM-dependent methyltransferase [Pseudonocardia abyssalis]|uniref:Methyltransferase type 11 domain-containing protein n=1 Tax=Pseudonocardia abyssalis TaxID=2792008 RepID=A0ABS6UV94_9PSEU|nr:class I SAM-dependent methyltransferase [Pseudonocardia abyssalis]MBW0116628.1 hypothetical protein [Pseudonocardia abyssalis]MBW0136155.1 hypothetical protein [Pseudonocardia abyssalis]